MPPVTIPIATRHRVIEGKNKAVVTTAVAAFHAR